MRKRIVFLQIFLALLPLCHIVAQAPEARAQNAVVYLDGSGNATLSANTVDDGSTATSGIASLSLDQTTYSCSNADTLPPITTALDFDGTNDFISVPNNSAYETSQGTLELWVKPTASSSLGSLVSMRSSSTRYSYYLNEATDEISIWNGVGYTAFTYTPGLDAGTWYHIAFVYYSSNRTDVYINGEYYQTLIYGPSGSSGLTLTIGSSINNGYEPFPGQMADIRIWNDIRTGLEIADNKNKILAGTEAGLVGYFPVLKGTGDTLYDHSANGNNGVLTNMDAATDWINTGTQVVLSVTDNNSNTATDTAYVTIVDNNVPTVTALDFTRYAIGNDSIAITTTEVSNGAQTSDNCSLSLSINRTGISRADSMLPLNRTLDFGGTTDYVVIPNHADFEFSTGTIELWVKPPSLGVSGIMGMRFGASTRFSFHLDASAGEVGLWNGGAYKTVSYPFTGHEWYHLAFHIVPNRVDVSVNAQKIGTFYSGINTAATGLDVGIGGSVPFPGFEDFSGEIDEVRFWNDTRTQSEIQSNMYQALSGNEANLVAYYPFNEAADTVVVDESAGGHNGAMVNMDPATERITNGIPVLLRGSDPAGNEESDLGFIELLNLAFLNTDTLSILENTTIVDTLATTNSIMSFFITGGVDSSFFEVSFNNLDQLLFKSAPDFETPLDGDGDNHYLIDVQGGNTIDTINKSFVIKVLDAEENPPIITSTSPADGATGINTNSNISITFNENIQFGSGHIRIIDLADGSSTDSIDVSSPGTEASISDSILTINPVANLDGLTQYAILIDSAAIEDASNNAFLGILDSSTLGFTTFAVALPAIKSAVLVGSPALTDSIIQFRITFSKAVQNVSIDDFKIDVVSGFAEGIITEATDEGDTAVLVTASIMGSEYNRASQVVRLGVAGDNNIKDLNGDALAFDNATLPTHTTTLHRNKGVLHMILEQDDLPSGLPFSLNTGSLGILIPQLSGAYPNSNPVRLEVVMDSLNPFGNTWTTTTENLTYQSNLDINIWVDTGQAEYVDVLTLTGLVSMVGSINSSVGSLPYDRDSLGYSLSSINFSNFVASNSTIGVVNTFLLQFKLNLASVGLVGSIGQRWSKLFYPMPPVVINELKYRDDGSDTLEFVEFYDGGIGNVELPFVNFNGFDQFTLTTGADGYFLIGDSTIRGVDMVWGSPWRGDDASYWPGDAAVGVQPELDDFRNIFPGALNNTYSLQRFPQGNTIRGDESILTSALPTPGAPNTLFLLADSLNSKENIDTLDIDAFGGDASNVDNNIIYSITGGADQNFFTINAANGILSFSTAPDFEDPQDANQDNTYEVEVTANRGAPKNDLDVRTFNISVIDSLDHIVWDNGSWSGSPNIALDAVIDDNMALSSFAAKKVIINSGTALNIDTNEVATISGNIVNNGNGFAGKGTLRFDNSSEAIELSGNAHAFEGVLEVTNGTTLNTNDSLTLTASSASSYGQISGDGTVHGNVTSQAWLDVNTARYYYLGSPFTNATLGEFNEGQTMVAANSNQGTVWLWNAANATWEAPSALTDVAANGKGYAIYAGTNTYGTFLMSNTGVSQLDGTVASGDISVPLGYNNGQSASVGFVGGTGQSATEGWNLLANPYPSQYDWSSQSLPSGMSNAIYVNQGGSFASYVSGIGTNGGTQYLAPFQGFWVQTTNASPGNFVFEQDQRVTAPATALMKTAVVDGVYLSLSDGVLTDELYIGFDPQATKDFDPALDARKLLNREAPNLSTSLQGEVYSICRVGEEECTSFPLSLDEVTDGQAYSFHVNTAELKAYNAVSLEDHMLHIVHDLKAADYRFTQYDAFGPGRFVLRFAQTSSINTPESEHLSWYAFATENGLQVELGALKPVDMEIFTIAGQRVYSRRKASGSIEVSLPGARGVYLIYLQAEGIQESKKVIR